MTRFISRIALPVLLIGLVVLFLRRSVLSLSPPVMIAQIGALALSVWARKTFRRGQFRVTEEPADGGLMEEVPYRHIRHPMYAAALLFVWASILGHWAPANAAIGLVITAVVAVRIASEERVLRQRLPGYPEYCRHTKRLIPYLL